MKKILIALDDSLSANRAIEYACSQFSGVKDVEICLVHVLPNLPAIFWDEGHILSDAEKKEREKVVNKWVADRIARMEPVFRRSVEALTGVGIAPGQVRTKSVSDSLDVSRSLVEEAKDGGYDTIVVGRCNHAARHLLGSVSGRIVNQGAGLAVTVVG